MPRTSARGGKGGRNPLPEQRPTAADQCRTVIILIAHAGLARPEEWELLLQGNENGLVIYVEREGGSVTPKLRPYVYPRHHNTAYAHVNLFLAMMHTLLYARKRYKNAIVCGRGKKGGSKYINRDRTWL